MQKLYCLYYQATVQVTTTWFVIGSFRNEDHVAFERTPEGQNSVLEFFVPESQEATFLGVMGYMLDNGYVLKLEKLPNRYQLEAEAV